MSTGSTNIVVQITDQVAPTIAPKIRDIANAATLANVNLMQLQATLSGIKLSTGALATTMNTLNQNLKPVGDSTNRLTGAFAQLAGRVVGAEAGFGMLGGAIARVGVAAGIAGPLIAAAVVVAAVVGAVLYYDALEKAARKLVGTQTELAEQMHHVNDTILSQKEELIGLTQGSVAKYSAMLADLPFKTINIDITVFNKLLEDQKSKVDTVIAALERYAVAAHNAIVSFTGIGTKEKGGGALFSLQDTEDFISNSKKVIAQSKNQKEALDQAINATGKKLNEIHDLEQNLTDESLVLQEKSRRGVQDYYDYLIAKQNEYLQKRAIDKAGKDAEFLTQIREADHKQLILFQEQLSALKGAEGVVSPQQKLALNLQQLQEARKGNVPVVEKQAATNLEAIDRENESLNRLLETTKRAGEESAAYSTELKIQAEQQKFVDEATKIGRDNKNLAFTISEGKLQIENNVRQAETNKALTATYEQIQGPLLKYYATLAATDKELKDGSISASQKAIADAKASHELENAVNPLNEYTQGLKDEVSTFGKYGTALTVANEILRIRHDLQAIGHDLNQQEIDQLTKILTALEQQRAIQAEVNQMYEKNSGAIQQLVLHQQALNKAVNDGVISQSQYKIATAQANVAIANQSLEQGNTATQQQAVIAGLGKVIQGYQGLAKGVSEAYGQAFQTIADGAANSLGRAIAYGEDLGKALKDVARQAVSELISAFIKLGIQWVITQALGSTIAAAANAATIAMAGAVTQAWAPAAAFASLATLGANAAPAALAMTSTVALSEVLGAVTGHDRGGMIEGPSGTDKILARLTRGEYVVNAYATGNNRDLLDSINSGVSGVRANSGVAVGTSPIKMQVNVHRDLHTNVDVQQMDDNTVRIIARQEAKSIVQSHAPSVIASDIVNPNSRTSKALSQNVDAKRRR